MIEISEYLWETLYAIKAVYDHDPKAQIFQLYKDTAIDGDDLFEIAENAINQFFADTREYFNEDNEVATYVFFDPIITQYWKLCDEYEKRLQLDPKENRFRSDKFANPPIPNSGVAYRLPRYSRALYLYKKSPT